MSARLPKTAGEWIDRSIPLDFEFEAGRFQGFAGDTVTSALCAAGVSALGRSFKYHRLRGVLSMANHDVNALFQDGGRLYSQLLGTLRTKFLTSDLTARVPVISQDELGELAASINGMIGKIQGIVCHHTAGPRVGNMPSLRTVTNGRPDLPGPLSWKQDKSRR